MEVVKYVSKTVNLCDSEVIFLSVIDKMPDNMGHGDGRYSQQTPRTHEGMDTYKEKRMRECMDSACKIMKNCGVPSEKINCNIQKRATGIARDILKECQFGYNAVAIGRRGLGEMDESMLGSIAAKVLINVVDAPDACTAASPNQARS